MRRLHGALEDYLRELHSRFSELDLTGLRVLLDCANGATFRAAPEIFRRLGAEVEVMADEPDGRNINDGCGSTHLDGVVARMGAGQHDVAFAFDGDGDRVLAVDSDGGVVDGDELIALAAVHLHRHDRLPGRGVAVTVMTNYGFHTAMAGAGVEVATTAVGDRYVLDELRRRGWALGGEQSGHIIDLGFGPCGDGIASALLTLEALGGRDLRERDAMEKLPQRLVNIRAADRGALAAAMEAAALRDAVAREEAGLSGRGRVLVRASGTEPLIRVMVEAPSGEETDSVCDAAGRGRPGDARRRSRARRRPRLKSRARPPVTAGASSRFTTSATTRRVGHVRHRRLRRPQRRTSPAAGGLEKLEYRGYDSAGISVLAGDRVDAVRAVGNLSALRAAIDGRDEAGGGRRRPAAAWRVAERPQPGTGIGHTRWATHGRVTEENAHPHFDTTDRVHIVVNGIVENYIALKDELIAGGAVFTSETDAEVIAHLVAHYYDGDLVAAVRQAYARLRGHYAFVAMSADEPGRARGRPQGVPADRRARRRASSSSRSAIPAFLRETRQVQYMNDDEIVVLRPDGVEFETAAGEPLEREVVEIDWDADTAEKQGYETFMLKEINEQADAVAETIGERAARGSRHRPRRPGHDRRRPPAPDPADRDRRLRHRLPRRADRPLRDRAVGPGPGRGRHRLRVPLPQPGGRPRRPGDRDLAVRRDRRHAGRDADRPRARRHRCWR